jgi:hypothetical protein
MGRTMTVGITAAACCQCEKPIAEAEFPFGMMSLGDYEWCSSDCWNEWKAEHHSVGCTRGDCICHDPANWIVCEEFLDDTDKFCPRCGWDEWAHGDLAAQQLAVIGGKEATEQGL